MDNWIDFLPGPIREWLIWAWFVVLGVWGGTASYLSRMKKKNLPFSLAELIGEWCISGFAGLMTALACAHYQFDYYLTAFCVGIAGHLGGRGMYMLEQWAVNKFKQVKAGQ